MRRIARSAIVPCSADALYELVEDIQSYPSFVPWCAAAKVLERTPGHTVATLTLSLKGMRASLTTENRNTPGRAIEMRQLEGPFRRFEASWHFAPLGARGAKVAFALRYELASRLLARALEPAFDRMADSTVEAFTRRATARLPG
ncbi:MAG: type II toxin-antitoxin system RatA family toxin [Pseudomonadota bacterium]